MLRQSRRAPQATANLIISAALNVGRKTMKTRTGAFLLHLAISLAVLLPVLGWIFYAWYPWPYPALQGAWPMLGMLVLAHLVVGPALTALVYKPGKRGLVFDLCVIGVLQLAALAWGVHAVEQRRPAWLVFAVDRLNVLTAGEVMGPAPVVPKAQRVNGPFPVFAEMPVGDARQRLLQETMFEGLPDLEHRPEFWRPWASGQGVMLRAAQPADALVEARPGAAGAVERLAESAGVPRDRLVFLPVMGRESDAAALLDSEDATLIGLVHVDPWLGDDAAE